MGIDQGLHKGVAVVFLVAHLVAYSVSYRLGSAALFAHWLVSGGWLSPTMLYLKQRKRR